VIGVIEWGKIGELLWVAPLASLVIALAFSLFIVGVTRSGEARRDGTPAIAAAYGLLGLVTGLGFVAVVVESIRVIVNK